MVRRSGLGKGLGALIPPTPGVATGSMLREVPLARIRPNPFQPRNQLGSRDCQRLSTRSKRLAFFSRFWFERSGRTNTS